MCVVQSRVGLAQCPRCDDLATFSSAALVTSHTIHLAETIAPCKIIVSSLSCGCRDGGGRDRVPHGSVDADESILGVLHYLVYDRQRVKLRSSGAPSPEEGGESHVTETLFQESQALCITYFLRPTVKMTGRHRLSAIPAFRGWRSAKTMTIGVDPESGLDDRCYPGPRWSYWPSRVLGLRTRRRSARRLRHPRIWPGRDLLPLAHYSRQRALPGSPT